MSFCLVGNHCVYHVPGRPEPLGMRSKTGKRLVLIELLPILFYKFIKFKRKREVKKE